MDELEAIRLRKIQELQGQAQEQAQFQNQIQQLENIVRTILTKEALERYGNVKAAHPEKAMQLLAMIGQVMQKGNIKKISDEELKKMLIAIQPKVREMKITRK